MTLNGHRAIKFSSRTGFSVSVIGLLNYRPRQYPQRIDWISFYKSAQTEGLNPYPLLPPQAFGRFISQKKKALSFRIACNGKMLNGCRFATHSFFKKDECAPGKNKQKKNKQKKGKCVFGQNNGHVFLYLRPVGK